MGSIAGMLGLAGGQGGTGFSTVQGVTPDQLKASYAGTQSSLEQQQALLQALGAQGGIQNQQQIYQQLQDIAAGKTGNLAQAQLQQATGANVANQAALMAGQRGAGANVGLMARQAAQQGAQTQQQAAGQAAALQAQQQLGAIQGAGNLATAQVGQQQAAQNAALQAQLQQQQTLQGANTAYSQQQADLAKGVMGMEGSSIGGLAQGIGPALPMLATIAAPAAAAAAPAAAMGAAGGAGGAASGLASMPAMFGAHGGEIEENFASGGQVNRRIMSRPSVIQSYLQKINPGILPMQMAQNMPITPTQPIMTPRMMAGGDVGDSLKAGGHVPGHANVPGDSLKNDTVHAMLSPGEIVLPRSVTQSANPSEAAARFVQAMKAKKGA